MARAPRKTGPNIVTGRSGTYEKKEPTETACMGWMWKRKAYCQRAPGWGTDHPGIGRCKHHGGCPKVKHGRNSKLSRYHDHRILGDRIIRAQEDADLLSLREEVALVQAHFEDFVSQCAERRFEGEEEERLYKGLEMVASLKERAHRVSLTWTDKRAEQFLDWIGQAIAKQLERRDIDRLTIGLVLQDLARMVAEFRV